MQEFTLSLAQELFESTEDFPVDFDLAYKWLGYTRKSNALKTLKDNFEKNVDYLLLRKEQKYTDSLLGVRPSDIYRLTVGCLKEMGMLAKTTNGKQIRRYFLECEKIAKQSIQNNLVLEIANKAVSELQAIKTEFPVTFQQAVEALGINYTPMEALNSSLVANRLGLAFNKHLKALETLTDATSPEAFNSLKEQYYQLAQDYSELMKIKTPKPKIEYVEHIVEVDKIIEVPVSSKNNKEISQLTSELAEIKQELKEAKRELKETKMECKDLKNKALFLEGQVMMKDQEIKDLKREVHYHANASKTVEVKALKPQIDKRFLLPGS